MLMAGEHCSQSILLYRREVGAGLLDVGFQTVERRRIRARVRRGHRGCRRRHLAVVRRGCLGGGACGGVSGKGKTSWRPTKPRRSRQSRLGAGTFMVWPLSPRPCRGSSASSANWFTPCTPWLASPATCHSGKVYPYYPFFWPD